MARQPGTLWDLLDPPDYGGSGEVELSPSDLQDLVDDAREHKPVSYPSAGTCAEDFMPHRPAADPSMPF